MITAAVLLLTIASLLVDVVDCAVVLQAVELLLRQADLAAREKELMKAVPDMDIINAFVGTVKLSMPGLVKIKQDVRKNKKKI